MKIHFEKIALETGNPVLSKVVRGKQFTAPLHFHPEVELTLIVESAGKRFVGDSIENFGPGDLVLVGPNLPHYWSNTGYPEKHTRAYAVVVQFNLLFLGDKFMELSGAGHIEKLLNDSRRGVYVDERTAKTVASRLMALPELDAFQSVLATLEILDIIARSKDYRLLSSQWFRPNPDMEDCRKINKVFDYVYDNLSGDLSISRIAHSINLSESAFCHYFRKRTQRTFTQFVNEIRIGRAKKALIESDDAVAEIAYACGFNSLSNFNKQFHTLTGTAPREFRKRYLTREEKGDM